MKFTSSIVLMSGLLFAGNAGAMNCNGTSASQIIDCILTEASVGADIEQSPKEGNSYMDAQKIVENILAKASKEADIEQAPSEGNSQMDLKRWKAKLSSAKSEKI